ncbi:MAG: phage terminase large subunit family protein [Hoeflea sp. D1-CHI-28]
MLDARTVADEAWRAGLRPEPPLLVSEWADHFRVLPSTSAEPGRWRTDRSPYLREIMDCMSISSPVERVVIMKGAQTGGTEAGLNFLGYVICNAPGLAMLVMPSVDMIRRNTRTRIDPYFEIVPEIARRVVPAKSREPGNTATHKKFVGGELVMTGANAAASLRSTPARYLVLDEIDAFPLDVEGEGDPIALAIQRTVTYRGKRKILMISTPTIKGFSRIEAAYLESDQRKYFTPCLHCGESFVITWSTIHWPKAEPERAHCVCPNCGGVHEERDKPAMLRQGEWRAMKPGSGKTAGYHLSALLSPFETWADIAEEHGRVHADPARLKSWVNTKLGETWEEEAAQNVDSAALVRRTEYWGEELPAGAAVITAGIDTQDTWLAAEIVAWGRGEESWSLDWIRLPGDPTSPQIWAELDAILARTFEHPVAGPLPIAAACIDSGGHHTSRVEEFTAARHSRRVYAIKGSSTPGKSAWPHKASYSRRGKRPIYIVGVDAIKELVFARLAKAEAGPGYCHMPQGRESAWFAEMTAEKPYTKYSKGRAIREWRKKPTERNEAFDCRVYAHAALESLKYSGFDVDVEANRIADMAVLRRSGGTTAPGQPAARRNVIRSRFLERR